MTAELTILAWTLVFAIVQVCFRPVLRTQETGVDYNASARDTPSPAPVGKLTGRLQRAQSSLFETLPLFAAAVLICTSRAAMATSRSGARLSISRGAWRTCRSTQPAFP